MSSTDPRAAAVFHAELLLPLQRANLRKGVSYLEHGKLRASYWRGIASRTGGIEQLPDACDVRVLLDRLRAHWVQQNQPALLVLLPHLEKLHQELTVVAAGEGRDDTDPPLAEFVYPLF
jgi:hypothetical protein